MAYFIIKLKKRLIRTLRLEIDSPRGGAQVSVTLSFDISPARRNINCLFVTLSLQIVRTR